MSFKKSDFFCTNVLEDLIFVCPGVLVGEAGSAGRQLGRAVLSPSVGENLGPSWRCPVDCVPRVPSSTVVRLLVSGHGVLASPDSAESLGQFHG